VVVAEVSVAVDVEAGGRMGHGLVGRAGHGSSSCEHLRAASMGERGTRTSHAGLFHSLAGDDGRHRPCQGGMSELGPRYCVSSDLRES
jgi:hypothetical protein